MSGRGLRLGYGAVDMTLKSNYQSNQGLIPVRWAMGPCLLTYVVRLIRRELAAWDIIFTLHGRYTDAN